MTGDDASRHVSLVYDEEETTVTDRPVDDRPADHDRRSVRRWLALSGAVALLVSALASPWAAGIDARPDARATPGTPRAPVEIRSTIRVRTISINGTPQPTATLPTEPEQGTPVPPAPIYNRENGFPTVPESSTGHELRLYRLTIAPGATFDLPESGGWTIIGSSGTVDVYPTTFGVRSAEGHSLTSASSTSGLPAATFLNLSAGEAVVWVIGVAPTGGPIPPGAAGVAFDLVGQTPLENLTAGSTIHVAFGFAAAGPVGRPLDPLDTVPQPDAPGSVPAGMVYGLQGKVSVVEAAGADPVPVTAGQSVSFPDLTGRSITGPAQRATDAPNEYIVVTAQEQVPGPAPNGTPGVARPPATPALVTPTLAGSPVAGDVVTCDAEPRTVEELQAAIDLLSATPTLVTDPFGRSARPWAGTGTPADESTIGEITSTLQEFSVCTANNDIARAIGLTTDAFSAFLLANLVGDLSRPETFATALPARSGAPIPFILSDVEAFPDGRAGALVYGADGGTYFTFARADDGPWLIDAFDQSAGQEAIAIDPVATPRG